MLGTRPVICTAITAKLYPAKKNKKNAHADTFLLYAKNGDFVF